MTMTYRKLAAADSKQYRAIRLESLKAHPESFGSGYEAQSKLPKLKFERVLEDPDDDGFLIGAFDQVQLVGICGFLPFIPGEEYDLEHTGVLIQVYVRAAYNGRKIGLNLVNATLAEAFKLPQIDQVLLEVKEGNMSAIRVYEQAGFVTYHAVGQDGEVINDGTRRMIINRES